MYSVTIEGNTSILYRQKKDGTQSVVCKVIDTVKDRLLVIDASKKSYRFRSSNGVKFKQYGRDKIAVIEGSLTVLKTPHASLYHYEVMKNNRLRYYLGSDAMLDYDALLENMLECIATM